MEAWLPGPGGHQFYTRTYAATGTARAAVVFIHGFAEHVGRHEHAHRYWQTKDITVFTFDQRGFGRTALDAEHKSKDAAYGKETFEDQMRDIEHWVRHVKKLYPELPLFLTGQSMVRGVCSACADYAHVLQGGGLVLSFPTQGKPPPSKEAVEMLAGVVGMSPLILQTTPVSKVLRKLGAAVSTIAPWFPFPAEVPTEVRPGCETMARTLSCIHVCARIKGFWMRRDPLLVETRSFALYIVGLASHWHVLARYQTGHDVILLLLT